MEYTKLEMNRRCTIPDFYGGQRKRICISKSSSEVEPNHHRRLPMQEGDLDGVFSALILLKSYFPVEKFEQRLPPIIIKHQLYSVINNKTAVDRRLSELKQNGVIRCFHLGAQTDNVCIVLSDDFKQHVQTVTGGNEVAAKFLNYVFKNNYDELSITRETLLKRRICKEEDITELMRLGLLTVRDVGSWWLAIPSAGLFMKFYLKGRKAILTMIRKSKYSEILEKELTDRKLPKIAKLGMHYYIHDVIGAELVTIIPTTSGRLLRLTDYD